MDFGAPSRFGATAALTLLRLFPAGTSDKVLRRLAAAMELISRATLTYKRPAYGIHTARVGNREVEVIEEVVHTTPFCSLLHFKKLDVTGQPRVLLCAPMSGHFATLLRGTVQTLLQDHDVYITDWHSARDVPLSEGVFGLDDFTEHLMTFWKCSGRRRISSRSASLACRRSPPLRSCARTRIPRSPASLTLMAGPIDTRVLPTKVNEFATTRSLQWFEHNMISYVPMRCAGALRRVYPGFLQVTGFVSMNLERHVKSHMDLMEHLANGDTEKADAIRNFYDEYFAVMDLPAEFFIETIQTVFQEHHLPLGQMTYRGRMVDPRAVSRMGLLTVEGEKDDICSIGQTVAAQDLCSNVRQYRKVHHLQAGAGHYGVFSGRRWNNEIYPLLRDFVHANA